MNAVLPLHMVPVNHRLISLTELSGTLWVDEDCASSAHDASKSQVNFTNRAVRYSLSG